MPPWDVHALSDAEPLHQVEPHVWLVVERSGSTCGKPQIDRALDPCDVHDLALAVP